MRVVRRGNDDETNVAHAQQLFEAAHDAHIGIELRRFVAATLQNRGEPQPRDSANHWRVECASRQAESNEPNVNHDESVPSDFCRPRMNHSI